jgi:four helix bundle protein
VRTKRFALAVVRLLSTSSKSDAGRIMGKQLLRSATAIAANYRSAGRARSRKEFASRLGIVLEEADESLFWLELLTEAEPPSRDAIALTREAMELVKIFSAAYRTSIGPALPVPRPALPTSPDQIADRRSPIADGIKRVESS